MLSTRWPVGAVRWGAVAIALFVAYTAAGRCTTGDVSSAITAAGICALPILVYVGFRWPLVFPFGLYAALVPIDNLLSISGGVTITKLLGIVAAGALLVYILISRRALQPGPAWLAWGAVIAWMAITTLWSVNQDETTKIVNVMLTLFGVYTVATMYPARRREFVVMCAMIIASGVALALYAYQQYQQGAFASDARLSLGADGYGIDPNHFAANFMLPLALAIMGFISIRHLWARALLAAAAGIMGLGLLLTGSRGGLISFAVLVVYIGIRTQKVRETVFVSAAALTAGFAFPTVFERFTDPTQGAASGRFYIWEIAGPALVRQMRWIYGNGLGSFPTVYNEQFRSVFQPLSAGYDRPGHNLIVQSSVELGIVGLSLVVIAWYWSWRSASVIPKGTPWFAARVASEGVCVALFATAMSVDVLWFKYLWLGFAIGPLARNAYAPTPFFGRRRSASASMPFVATVRNVARNSSSVAAFEQTSVAPEM